MPRVELLCLANSRKHSNRCVAGLALDGSGWVRPVSDLPDGSLKPTHYRCDDGEKAALLDVLCVDLSRPERQAHQPENWRMGTERWRRARIMPAAEALCFLKPYLVTEPNLLGNALDRVPYAQLTGQPGTASLALVEPAGLQWVITSPVPGSRRVRASFELGGGRYNLMVTDPEFEFTLIPLADGRYDNEAVGIKRDQRPFFTISLSEPFKGDCYKLVAAVIVLPRV